MQAVRSARLADTFGYVGVAHDVQLPGQELFFSRVHLHGGLMAFVAVGMSEVSRA